MKSPGPSVHEEIQQLRLAVAQQHEAISRYQSEVERLRSREKKLNQIMDSMPAMIGYVDLNQRLIFANNQLERWYQLSREQLIGMRLSDLFSAQHYRTVSGLLTQVLSGKEVNHETQITYPDGVRRHVQLNYIPDIADDKVLGYYFLVRDIGERKRAELQLKFYNEKLDSRIRRATRELQHSNQELREEIQIRKRTEDKLRASQEWLKEALESMTDGFLLFDSGGELVAYSSKILQLFPSLEGVIKPGVTFRELLLTSARAGEVKEAIGRVGEWLDERMENYPDNTGSVEVQLADGRWILATDRLTSARGVVGLRTEITDRKQDEEKIRLQQEQMASVLRRASMGEMASALAHEMSQPLAAITNYSRGSLRRLQSRQDEIPDVIKALERACQEADRAKDIIRHVSDFVRKTTPEVNDHPARELVLAVFELAASSMHRNDVRGKLHLSHDHIVLSINRIEIEQVLFNLIRNSIDSLKPVKRNDKRIVVSVSLSPDRGCEFFVEDNGLGIPDEVRDKVFDPYVTTKQSGLGMGLSISRTIIESHGGQLWIDPAFHAGTRMVFNLPDVKVI